VREFRAGMAEVIKYGIIWDPGVYPEGTERSPGSTALLGKAYCKKSSPFLSSHVSSAKMKKERDLAIMVTPLSCCRKLNGLSFIHGGMVAAGQLVELQFWEQASQERQLALIQKTGLPSHTSKRF